jgi:hypothetical protein
MKVLKKGRKQKGWSVEKTCTGKGNGLGGCGALLLVEENDLYETGEGGDGPDYARTFKCSECGVETDFDLKEVPVIIWDRTTKRRKSK